MGRTNEIDRNQDDPRDYRRPRQPRPAQPTGEVEVREHRGVVNNINGDRGFAFVDGENGIRYFAHFSVCLPDNRATFERLQTGTRVIFDGIRSDKGPRCETLRLADAA